MVEEFAVEDMIYSDHQPLATTLRFLVQEEQSVNNLTPLPRLRWQDRYKNLYAEKLNEQIEILGDTVCTVENLEACIKTAAEPMQTTRSKKRVQPWFDRDCEIARKKSFLALRTAKRRCSAESRREYSEANKDFKTMCLAKKTEFFQRLSDSLSQVKDSKEFWSIVKKLNGAGFPKSTQLDAVKLGQHFKELLGSNDIVEQEYETLPFIAIEELDSEITYEEVVLAIQKAKANKAAGPDGIPAEFFKNATPEFIEKLTLCFNRMFDTGSVSINFQRNIIFPLFKKGDVNDPSNYRGISFQNSIAKIFTYILLNRLTLWVEGNSLLSEYQAGFRKGYSTVDNIFCLSSLSRYYIDKGKKLYALFIDFKAAFDSIIRKKLFYKLHRLGISTKMLTIIKSLYTDNKAAVWDGQSTSDWFETENGVKQGCHLSPLLFALFLDDLVSYLPPGIQFAGEEIKVLMYADDIVILADSPHMLQRMINRLAEYCNDWNLTINLNKTKILIFRRSKGRYCNNEKWHLQGHELEKVKQYKYLGVLFTHDGRFHKHLFDKLQAAKTAINCTWNSLLRKKGIAHSVKYKLYEAAVRSIMGYASEVWGWIDLKRSKIYKGISLKNSFAYRSTRQIIWSILKLASQSYISRS